MTALPPLAAVIYKLNANRHRLGIELNPPAMEADIQRLEQALGRPLPPDIAAFYRYCNGFETDDDMFRVVPIAESMEWSQATLAQGRFIAAEYIIRSDLWELVLESEVTQYRVVNDIGGSEKEVTSTASLYHFISRYLDGEEVYALYDWYQEKKQKMSPLGSA